MADPKVPDVEIGLAQLIGKLEIICRLVERGRRATDTWHVGAHNALRVTSIIFSVLGGAGLVAVNVNPDLPKEHGAALAGSMVSLIFSILMQLANEFGLESRAGRARSAAADFATLDTKLEIILRNADPVDLLNKLLEESDALLNEHGPVLPELSGAMQTKAKSRCNEFVKLYQPIWVLRSGRKPKKPKPPAAVPAEPHNKGHEV